MTSFGVVKGAKSAGILWRKTSEEKTKGRRVTCRVFLAYTAVFFDCHVVTMGGSEFLVLDEFSFF
jgi:hypothetical protein